MTNIGQFTQERGVVRSRAVATATQSIGALAAGAIALAAFVIGLRTGGTTRSAPFQAPAGEPLSTR